MFCTFQWHKTEDLFDGLKQSKLSENHLSKASNLF